MTSLRVMPYEEQCPAWPGTGVPEVYGDEASWRDAGSRSDVRFQWDPDHDPQRDGLRSSGTAALVTPEERVYGVADPTIARRLDTS